LEGESKIIVSIFDKMGNHSLLRSASNQSPKGKANDPINSGRECRRRNEVLFEPITAISRFEKLSPALAAAYKARAANAVLQLQPSPMNSKMLYSSHHHSKKAEQLYRHTSLAFMNTLAISCGLIERSLSIEAEDDNPRPGFVTSLR
jgi:hypothetical protein